MRLELGKRIVQLQASLALAQGAQTAKTKATQDAFGRTPFTHQALNSLNNLTQNRKNFLTNKLKLAELADKYEMQKVLRWSPRQVGYTHAGPMMFRTYPGANDTTL